MDASPSSVASSCTSHGYMDEYQTLPREKVIEARTMRLVPLNIAHQNILWQQLREEENAKLFQQYYGTICASKTELRDAITEYDRIHEDSLTLTILDKKTNRASGWVMLQSVSGTVTVHCALFLLHVSRAERGAEALHYICRLVFNELEFEIFEFSAGKLSERSWPKGSPLGMSLIDVIIRQQRDDARSQENDVYVLPRKEWPHVYAAVNAWLDAKEGCESGNPVGSSLALSGFGFG